jgi:hypothetical protein
VSVTLRSVWAPGADFAIAVGDDLSWQQYAQGAWTSVGYPSCWGANPPPPPATIPNFVHAIWGADKGNIWIVGPYGKMMHNTGGSTTCVDLPSGKWLYDVWGSGPSDVFAVGADGGGTDPHLVHYDGLTWSDWSDRLRPFGSVARGVWGSGPSNVFVTVDTKVVRYDGTTWSDTGLVSPHKLRAIWGSGPTDIFAVGAQGAIFHYDGTAWSQMVVPVGTTIPTNEEWTDVHGLASDDVYVVGSRTLLHYDGASWAPVNRLVASGAEGVFAVPGKVFVAGEAGIDPTLIGRLQ